MEETIIQILAGSWSARSSMYATLSPSWTRATRFPSSPVTARSCTGGMDDQLIRQLAERLQYLRNLQQRGTR